MHKITMRTIQAAMWQVFEKRGRKDPPTLTALCRAAVNEHLKTGRPISREVLRHSYITGGYITPLQGLNTLTDFITTARYTKA